jgi:tRNA A-37 threonylcarbamoyl transferase component Bud32/membrane-associated phospholipid phosphatase
VSDRTLAAPPSRPVQRRRRRPTGAPPPLPRDIGLTGKLWLAGLILLLVWVVASLVWTPSLRATDRVDAAILRAIATARTEWLSALARFVDRVGSGWAITVLSVGLITALVVFRRWRHLLTFIGSLAVLQLVGQALYDTFSRPRPYDVTTIGPWAGYSLPSPPMAILATVLVSIAYTVVVPGSPRTKVKIGVGTLLVVFGAARLYLAVDHPFDVLVGAALGVAIPLTAFRVFTPNTVFPVSYRRAKTAHLDVGGRRGEAIRQAVRDQLGLDVVEAVPVGLEGSAGSTPLRLRVAGDPETTLFAKLYAMSHVRADRWYKLGRTLLYGRLEDEAPFGSVRRLVEYEDYALRLLRDAGIPTAEPYGVVEITPDREYLLVMGFLEGAHEIGVADIDDQVIDEALGIIRAMWDAGLAHRDIKPANLLVKNDHVYLIDAFFLQVRPSPWRQAVDLANMMLVLGVRTDAERVYQRALRRFTPEDIAEAFAAARGVASPTQLRAVLKQDGRDLLGQFRALAPHREPISLQRWSVRRVAIALALVLGVGVAVGQISLLLRPARDIPLQGTPLCGTDSLLVLMAQAVPSATSVPCIASLPAGWEHGQVQVRRNHAMFTLNSDVGGEQAVTVTLRTPDQCDVGDAMPVATDELGTQRYERPEQLPPELRATRYYLFEGGCVTYEYAFKTGATPALMFDADQALSLQPRLVLVQHVKARNELRLCGAGAPCPGGDS